MSSTSIGNGYSSLTNYCNNQLYDNYFNSKVGFYSPGAQNYDNTNSNFYYMLQMGKGDHYLYNTSQQYKGHGSLSSTPLIHGIQNHNLNTEKNCFDKTYTNASFSSGSLPSVADGTNRFENCNQKLFNNNCSYYQQNQSRIFFFYKKNYYKIFKI